MTLVDLTVPITVGMLAHPAHFGPSVEPYARHAEDGFRATSITLSSHLGTHVDAPSHFVGDGATLEHVRIDDLIGPAEVVRFRGLAPLQELMPEDVPDNGASRILLHTGWADETGQLPRYFTEYPSISAALARALVARGVVLVGLDTPSVDHDPGETHHILLGAGVVIVENLVGLERIPDQVDLIVLPLPIVGGDGCPARAIASFDGALR
jgi:arylformamidase